MPDQTNIHGLHPELQKLLGRLKYRTSYGQNAFETFNRSCTYGRNVGFSKLISGADVKIIKRGGLLHDR